MLLKTLECQIKVFLTGMRTSLSCKGKVTTSKKELHSSIHQAPLPTKASVSIYPYTYISISIIFLIAFHPVSHSIHPKVNIQAGASVCLCVSSIYSHKELSSNYDVFQDLEMERFLNYLGGFNLVSKVLTRKRQTDQRQGREDVRMKPEGGVMLFAGGRRGHEPRNQAASGS